MKHNLPTPSQAWGSDIDRRVAYLENDMTLMKSKVSNSYDAVSALTSTRAANGVAQPFYHELFIEQPGARPGIGAYEDLWTLPLDWGYSGSFMQLSITGYLYLPTKEIDLSNYTHPQAVVGVSENWLATLTRFSSVRIIRLAMPCLVRCRLRWLLISITSSMAMRLLGFRGCLDSLVTLTITMGGHTCLSNSRE